MPLKTPCTAMQTGTGKSTRRFRCALTAGKNMTEETQGYWTCIPCDVTRTEDEINQVIDLAEYESCNLELDEDYGEFQYDDGRRLLAGVPDWYYFYADHTPND